MPTPDLPVKKAIPLIPYQPAPKHSSRVAAEHQDDKKANASSGKECYFNIALHSCGHAAWSSTLPRITHVDPCSCTHLNHTLQPSRASVPNLMHIKSRCAKCLAAGTLPRDSTYTKTLTDMASTSDSVNESLAIAARNKKVNLDIQAVETARWASKLRLDEDDTGREARRYIRRPDIKEDDARSQARKAEREKELATKFKDLAAPMRSSTQDPEPISLSNTSSLGEKQVGGQDLTWLEMSIKEDRANRLRREGYERKAKREKERATKFEDLAALILSTRAPEPISLSNTSSMVEKQVGGQDVRLDKAIKDSADRLRKPVGAMKESVSKNASGHATTSSSSAIKNITTVTTPFENLQVTPPESLTKGSIYGPEIPAAFYYEVFSNTTIPKSPADERDWLVLRSKAFALAKSDTIQKGSASDSVFNFLFHAQTLLRESLTKRAAAVNAGKDVVAKRAAAVNAGKKVENSQSSTIHSSVFVHDALDALNGQRKARPAPKLAFKNLSDDQAEQENTRNFLKTQNLGINKLPETLSLGTKLGYPGSNDNHIRTRPMTDKETCKLSINAHQVAEPASLGASAENKKTEATDIEKKKKMAIPHVHAAEDHNERKKIFPEGLRAQKMVLRMKAMPNSNDDSIAGPAKNAASTPAKDAASTPAKDTASTAGPAKNAASTPAKDTASKPDNSKASTTAKLPTTPPFHENILNPRMTNAMCQDDILAHSVRRPNHNTAYTHVEEARITKSDLEYDLSAARFPNQAHCGQPTNAATADASTPADPTEKKKALILAVRAIAVANKVTAKQVHVKVKGLVARKVEEELVDRECEGPWVDLKANELVKEELEMQADEKDEAATDTATGDDEWENLDEEETWDFC